MLELTVLSHAGALVRGDAGSLVLDPWLVGSCYWRSWWNFPEPDRALIDGLAPDVIYLTHLHWDHFHGPSLRRFDRATRVLVPLMPTRRMVEDLGSLGFRNVEEIPHGGSAELWPGTSLHAFHFGPFFTDSAAVVTDGTSTILDANDCKIFGLPLEQLRARFPRVDLCLRSHSSAGPLPYCVEGWEETHGAGRTKEDYLEEFTRACLSVGARFAVPFASNHCFVHPETRRFNATAVHPGEVAAHFDAVARAEGLRARCQVMAPGSTWSSETGFSLRDFDWSRRDELVAALIARLHGKLEAQRELEARARGSFPSFERYFRGLVDGIPLLLRHRMPRMAFAVVESGSVRHWLVDMRRGEVAEVPASPEDVDFVIEVAALVLNDCTRKRMFSAWTPSKRLRIRLVRATTLRPVSRFFQILDIHENDGLPLSRNLSRRHLGCWARRWREGVEALRLGARHLVLRRPLVVRDLYPAPPPGT